MQRSVFAETLIAARKSAGLGEPQVTALPDDHASAMAVQQEVAEALGTRVVGWKLGFAPDGRAVAGPLFAELVRPSPARFTLPSRGFVVEIELAFRLGRDLPKKDWSRDDVLDAVEEVLVGIELVGGRRGEPPGVPYFAFLADNIGNAGYATGASTREFRALDLKALPVRFSIDDALVEEKRGGHPQGDPAEPLRAYAADPNDRLGGLRMGQVVTTGSLTKPLRVDKPARIVASIAGVGEVRVDLVAPDV
jgi:2-keto-4-pentenoate hydratase